MSGKEDELDPRVVRTRQMIKQSFMELLEEKGFQAVTVQDIAGRATINRATFYAHFDDKYALFDQVIHESFEQMLQARLPPDAGFSLDNLRLLIVTVCEYLDQLNRHQCRSNAAQFEPLIEKEVQSQVYHLVLQWVAPSQGNRETAQPAPEVIASAISWAIFGAGLHWSRGEKKSPAGKMATQLLPFIAEGLRSFTHPEMGSAWQGAD